MNNAPAKRRKLIICVTLVILAGVTIWTIIGTKDDFSKQFVARAFRDGEAGWSVVVLLTNQSEYEVGWTVVSDGWLIPESHAPAAGLMRANSAVSIRLQHLSPELQSAIKIEAFTKADLNRVEKWMLRTLDSDLGLSEWLFGKHYLQFVIPLPPYNATNADANTGGLSPHPEHH